MHLRKAFSGLLFSAVTILLQKKIDVYFPGIYSFLTTIVITSSLFVFIDPLIAHFPNSVKFLRRLNPFFSKLEGMWIEIVDDNTYSIIKVNYDNKFGKFILDGNNYGVTGEKTRHFDGRTIGFDINENRTTYYYRACPRKKSGQEKFDGIGLIEFSGQDKNNYSAHGYFVSYSLKEKLHNFEWEKLHDNEIENLIGTKKLNPKNTILFIKQFHMKRSGRMGRNGRP